jgi:hypothetical protein
MVENGPESFIGDSTYLFRIVPNRQAIKRRYPRPAPAVNWPLDPPAPAVYPAPSPLAPR